MRLKKMVKKAMPNFIMNQIHSYKRAAGLKKDAEEFSKLETVACDASNLRSAHGISLSSILNSDTIEAQWAQSKKEIEKFTIPGNTGGVNYGDRRAIYYLINYFKPQTILEIGTHIGASTLNIASALYHSQVKQGNKVDFTTLDIRDVNCTKTKPWLDYGTKYSPLEMIENFNYDSFVTFISNTSLEFLSKNDKQYDFIFLDGDHSQATVYKEVPLALSRLKKNGVILLHDYFPNSKPLWSNGTVIYGPHVAVERLIKEGADLVVLPLGELPWPTKLDSNVTSLALLMSKSD